MYSAQLGGETSHTDTHTNSCGHARKTDAQTRRHTHADTRTRTHRHTNKDTQTHEQGHTDKTVRHVHTHAHTCTHADTTHRQGHTDRQSDNTQTRAHKHVIINESLLAHTHTHTHHIII